MTRIMSSLLLAGCALAATATFAHGEGNGVRLQQLLAETRRATLPWHDLQAAQAAGYTVLVQDVAGNTCIDQPGEGAMGQHYANLALLADPTLDPQRPEVLMYARGSDGKPRLVGMEYIVDQRSWDALHAQAPVLFGHPLHLVRDGNRYGLPAFYELHLWLWKPNPNGLFNDWNPNVHCH